MMKLRKFIKYIFHQFTPFKAQKYQDLWVIVYVHRFMRKGYFVDLAAADGTTHSNTFALEKIFGWRGICIEPNPIFYEEMKNTRNVHCEKAVISNNYGKVKFRIDNGQLGGIIDHDTDNNPSYRSMDSSDVETISLNTIPLMDILEKYNSPKIIDYLSLDVEGSEERVITGIDFNQYIFNCITIERPTPLVNGILVENGYRFVKNFKYDTFYIHSSKIRDNMTFKTFEQVVSKKW